MRTGDLCELAADLVLEHGTAARHLAQHAIIALASDGQSERVHFWQSLSLLLDDILARRLDPSVPLTIH
ncbi:MAG: hypothetical protein JO208_03365 [Alphaproteobacteria bacterium]|nr:hypothetical protein [Alphaproteobacteria bacterium]MBV9911148.1 hypothetical protein [Nevskiaceae bacterium]